MPDFDAKETAKQVAEDLLDIGAVFLRPDDPFTWVSGIRSPIYCDNRLILSYPAVRGRIEAALAEMISASFPTTETLMGTATAGIAHAALVAQILDLPMGYVRSGSKGHGRGNQIEGRFEDGQRAVVVEDLISTGGSSVDSARVLSDAGLEVLAVAAIFTYGMEKAEETMKSAGLTCRTLTDLDTLVEVAVAKGYLSASQAPEVLRFRDDPASWWKEETN